MTTTNSLGGPINYPAAGRGDQVDEHFGAMVPDPYRDLENPEASETRSWVEAQRTLTRTYLAQLPARDSIHRRLLQMWNYESRCAPYKQGKYLFYWRDEGLQNHAVLYVVEGPGGEPRVLIDPNSLSGDGSIALTSQSVSHDGNLVAYGVSLNGSDWTEWRVRDVASSKDLADHLLWIKFSSVSWAKDGSGFYYSRFDEPTDVTAPSFWQKLFFHKLGTPQSQDTLVFHQPDQKDWRCYGCATEDGHYLIIQVYASVASKNRVYYKDLATGQLVKLLDAANARWGFIDNQGPIFWFWTDLNAPRGRLVSIDVSRCTADHVEMKEVIGQVQDCRVSLSTVRTIGKRFFAIYQQDACTLVKQFDLEGSFITAVQLPGLGAAYGFAGRLEDMETYYSFESYTTPATIFRYDIARGQSDVYFKSASRVDPKLYVTKLVFVSSKDGTKIPLFINYRKGVKRNGSNPTRLHGYGGFGSSQGPGFYSANTLWMDMGGIYAEALLRGGGEYGQTWHDAATKLGKQNTFDDGIACAQWLIDNGYTSAPKLAIEGTSNGGLLVCACLTQRPHLFAAAIARVPVTDMLRYQLFTAGSGWTEEYGCVTDGSEQFQALLAYSPYHNLKPGTVYPATLICAAEGDDRVVPAHSYKFAAALQNAQAGGAPCLIRIEEKAGHGAGTPLDKAAGQMADELAFLVHVLRIPKHKVARALGIEPVDGSRPKPQ